MADFTRNGGGFFIITDHNGANCISQGLLFLLQYWNKRLGLGAGIGQHPGYWGRANLMTGLRNLKAKHSKTGNGPFGKFMVLAAG